MGTSCPCCNRESITEIEFKKNNINDYEIETLFEDDYNDVENRIQQLTGFNPYKPQEIKLNKTRNKIEGTYYQYNKGCILYALINNGYIDELLIPDSMKNYKDRSHKEDQRNDVDLLKKIMSVIDLAQLWVNVGGQCPYLELDLKEVKEKIFLVLKEYFTNLDEIPTLPENEKEERKKSNTDIMKRVSNMTWQTKDYFELLGNIKIEYTKLIDIREINEDPCIKNGIEKNIIKERDIIKYGRHCFIFEKVLEENSKKKYYFQDSLGYFRETDKNEKNYNNCDFSKKGYVIANEDSIFINIKDPKVYEIGIVKVIV